MALLLNSFLAGYPIPPDMLHSYITVLPKEGKNPHDPSTHWPIALLNTDLKIFTCILANRLSTVLPNIISKDQVGFINFGRAGDNTRRAIDIIDAVWTQRGEAILFYLEAEVFDCLSWPFHFKH